MPPKVLGEHDTPRHIDHVSSNDVHIDMAAVDKARSACLKELRKLCRPAAEAAAAEQGAAGEKSAKRRKKAHLAHGRRERLLSRLEEEDGSRCCIDPSLHPTPIPPTLALTLTLITIP